MEFKSRKIETEINEILRNISLNKTDMKGPLLSKSFFERKDISKKKKEELKKLNEELKKHVIYIPKVNI